MKKSTLSFSGLALMLSFLALSAASPAQADYDHSQDMVPITSDYGAGLRYTVKVLLSADNLIQGMGYASTADARNFSISELETDSGKVMMTVVDGGTTYNIITLKATDVAPNDGGKVSMTYLYNGILGSYRSVDMLVKKEGDRWVLRTDDSDRKLITGIFFKTRKMGSRVFGVKAQVSAQ
jgi:hypothetical protein